MSLLRPKDDDYILRGILLLLAWLSVGMPIATTLAVLAFHGPAGVLGIPISIGLGLWGYSAYLNYGLRIIAEKGVKRMRLDIELRRICHEEGLAFQRERLSRRMDA